MQSRVGVREAIDPWARKVVRSYLTEQHRDFYSKLPFVVAAARDRHGRPWVTLLAGSPGFVASPDATHLRLATRALRGDALEDALVVGADLGLLGIELESRRRNRVNGTITGIDARGIELSVGQTFGNCPQYITARPWREINVATAASSASRHRRLDADMRRWIASADTMFIASGYSDGDPKSPANGMDASHRGGPAGFVEVLNDRRLVLPDFAGNNHFNTIGNLVVDPRVGLLFVDFETGGLLQISGTATIDWDSEAVAKHPGANRLVIVDVARIVRLDGVLPLRWGEPRGSIRSLKLAARRKESEDVTSFTFVARDDGDLPDFVAGQHLPIEVRVTGHELPLSRTYSLSNGPGERRYRISVKRDRCGAVSRHLHDHLDVGDIVSSGRPDGDFVLEPGDRPVALIGAGIGVTPLVSMLHALTHEKGDRPVFFVHGARDGAHHPLAEEVRDLARRHANVRLLVTYSRPGDTDMIGTQYDRRGRVTGGLIAELIPYLHADFYLCGPTGFLTDITTALAERGVDAQRIHSETF